MAVEQLAETRAAIVTAAARLLREHGVGAVTTRGVAQAAGVQPPTIYRLFGDKDGLLDALAEDAMATYVATKADASAEGDPVAQLRAGWRAHIDFGLANPDLYLLLHAAGRRSPATAAGIEVLRHRVHRLAAAGLLRVPEPDAVEIIHAAGTGAILATLGKPPAARDHSLADALFAAISAAILTAAPAVPGAGALPVAIAFATTIPDLPALTAAERALMAEWLARVTAAEA